jgi:hypothetical protein
MPDHYTATCQCPHQAPDKPSGQQGVPTQTMIGSATGILTSLLIGFFPKCPLCWAVYMSALGSLGLAKIPYMPWLLPVFLLMLAMHLFLVGRNARRLSGYQALILSLTGTLILVLARFVFPEVTWLTLTGMLLVTGGSVWNAHKSRLACFR